MSFEFKLEKVLDEVRITKNYLSRESKIRPATVLDLASGKAKRLELPTVEKLLDTINEAAKEKNIDKVYTIDDLVKYQYEKPTDQ